MVTFVLVLRTTSRSCSVLKITFAPFAQAFSAYNKLDADLKLTLHPYCPVDHGGSYELHELV